MIDDQQHLATEGVVYILRGEWDLTGQRNAAGSGLYQRSKSPGELQPLNASEYLLLAEIALKQSLEERVYWSYRDTLPLRMPRA